MSVDTPLPDVQLEICETKSEVLDNAELDGGAERTPRKRKMGRRHAAPADTSAIASVEGIGSSSAKLNRKRARTTTQGSFSEVRRADEGVFSKVRARGSTRGF